MKVMSWKSLHDLKAVWPLESFLSTEMDTACILSWKGCCESCRYQKLSFVYFLNFHWERMFQLREHV